MSPSFDELAVEELAHKEIAAILGIAEGTAWSRLHAARKRLAVEIGAVSESESGGEKKRATS